MILFFKTPAEHIIATEMDHQPSEQETQELCWLYDNATLVDKQEIKGYFVGPRREMITPWSTNAVEITQNMALKGISRIEEYFPVQSAKFKVQSEAGTPTIADVEGADPMLQRLYDGLDQSIFTVNKQPEPIKYIENIEEHNDQEGLALSKEEIGYLYKVAKELGRPLTDSELFGFAQINSEHCRHKIFGGTFIIDGKEMESSLFNMIKKTTKENPNKILSAYADNVAFAQGPMIEQFAPADHSQPDLYKVKEVESVISLKAETHNFPTTVEPFNGAATGTGGEIRDRMGGGTGSWPIAGTAVYMTSYPRKEGDVQPWEKLLPVRKWLYQTPEQILIKASNGASDFGNKFGQPLICGSVLTFEHCENPNAQSDQLNTHPLGDGGLYAYDKVIMLAGGVGYGIKRDCLKGEPQPGNKIVVMGGENYRIGLGGGSVSSVETGRYSSGIELNAVQRANPEMQKRTYNVVRALGEEEVNPIVSIHDHGSAGHVNCLSELVEECGGLIKMDKLPVGDKTLSAKEIIANESQERMGLLIDEKSIDYVQKIADRERAPMYTVGETTGDHRFAFEQADGVRPFDLSVSQMFGSSPKTIMEDETVSRKYEVVSYDLSGISSGKTLNDQVNDYLKQVLQLEAVACKDWLTNKVDRSVTGRVARQQCCGVLQLPLADCGAVALDYTGTKGIATALGHAPQAALADPEAGSVLSVAEALTNIVWAPMADGMDSISLSANWMWPCRAQKGEDARLYKAVKALSDFCCELQVNVPTGKDSLSMTQKYPDGTKIIAPGTVIVSAGGEVSDIKKVVTPDLKWTTKSRLYHIDFSFDELQLGGSAFAQSQGKVGSDVPTVKNPEYFRDAFMAIQQCVNEGLILAGHDISAGGLITTLLEMCFSNVQGGLKLDLDKLNGDDIIKVLFAENPGIVIQVRDADAPRVKKILEDAGVGYAKIGVVTKDDRKITIKRHQSNKSVPNAALANRELTLEFNIDELRDTWFSTSYMLDRKQSFNGKASERFINYKNQPVEWTLKGEPLKVLSALLPTGKMPCKVQAFDDGQNAENGVQAQNGKRPVAAIIREKGTNSEREMAWSFYMAGFDVKDVTMTDLISGRETLEEVNMIAFCGGFSNSDVLGSAKGWAGAFLYNPKAKEALDKFYARKDTLSFGVCNGCQLMVELGLLNHDHAVENARDYAQMLHNDSHKFESAFVTLAIPENNSVMFGSLSGEKIGCWVAHGEGKFALPLPESQYSIVAKFNHHEYPANPNGSSYDVAAIASADGRHLAIMPHPERTQFPWQCGYYPEWRKQDEVTPWHEAFVNARKWIEKQCKE